MPDSEPSITIDRVSPVPLYFQVAEQMERAIVSGALPPGHRLTNEVDLAVRLGLSRPTMRRAIQELVKKGLLVRRQGVGTQVVHSGLRREVRLSSLYDDLNGKGQQPGTKLLYHGVDPAPEVVATELGLEPETPVRHIERLRTTRGEPLAILRNWLPETLLSPSDAHLESSGLYEIMRTSGVHIHIARQRIGARGATSAEGKLLGLRKNAPLLSMQRTAYDDHGRAVEYGTHVYVPDDYHFEVTLVND